LNYPSKTAQTSASIYLVQAKYFASRSLEALDKYEKLVSGGSSL